MEGRMVRHHYVIKLKLKILLLSKTKFKAIRD
jgi:hypothetical protein